MTIDDPTTEGPRWKRRSMRHLAEMAGTLSRLAELNAPEVIIANSAMLVFNAALGAAPELGSHLTNILLANARRRAGYCLKCDNDRTGDDDDLCAACRAKMDQDIAELEAQLAEESARFESEP